MRSRGCPRVRERGKTLRLNRPLYDGSQVHSPRFANLYRKAVPDPECQHQVSGDDISLLQNDDRQIESENPSQSEGEPDGTFVQRRGDLLFHRTVAGSRKKMRKVLTKGFDGVNQEYVKRYT
jgi:hypothetical protein